MKNVNDLTSNQFYGGLNRRFDKRASLLHKLGFVYTSTMLGDRKSSSNAFFIRHRYGVDQVIMACTLSSICNRQWFDTLRQILH